MSGWHEKGATATALCIHRETFNFILKEQPEAQRAFYMGKFEALESVTGKLKDKMGEGCYKSLELFLGAKSGWYEGMIEAEEKEDKVVYVTIG